MPGNQVADQRDTAKKRRWFERTISLDLTISLVLLVIITSTLVTVFTYFMVSESERERLNSYANDYMAYLLESLELPMWTLDNKTVRKIAESYFNNQQISSIDINEVLNDNGDTVTKRVISLQKINSQPLLQKSADIIHNDRKIGTITISLSNKLYQESLRRFLWSSVATVVLVVFILILMVQVLLRWIVQKPIEQMLVGIEEISQGNYNYQFKKAPQKEIRTVAERFTAMAQRIQMRENSLASVNRQLQEEIRERKRGEAAVRQSEALLRATLDSTADGILVADGKGKVLTANDRFMDMWRIPQHLLEEKNDAWLLDFVQDQIKDPDGFKDKVAALYQSDTVSIDEIEFRDGRIFERYSCPFVLEGKHLGRVWNFRDITDRKRTLNALRESETRFRQLSEAALEAIVIHDNGVVLQANRRYFSMFGLQRSDVIGKPSFLQSEKPHPVYIENMPETNGEKGFVETTGRRNDGTLFPIVVRNKRMMYYGRSVNVTIIRDITERKKAEEERSQLQEKLSRSQKMEALGLLAGGVAHDLNNILSGIVSYPELLLMKGGLDEKTTKALETILDSGHRAAEVVNDLTTISKGIASTREIINMNRIVKEYLKSAEYQRLTSHHPGVTVLTQLDSELMNISGSAIHIRKTIMNLVTNACEAIQESGEVVITTRNRYLDSPLDAYTTVETGEYAVLSVSDTGPGVNSEDLERIFEPFYTKKVMGRSGTGLGLTVVWNTVKDHGGYVDVVSGTDGTRFDLYFPITREGPNRSEETQPIEQFQGRNEKILVIDDEKSQREIAVQILSFLGYSVDTVAGGAEAIAYLRRHQVDLIVLDMIMPSGMSGRETYEALVEIQPGVKTIIASGFSVTEDVKAIQQQGAGHFIKKPYTIKRLGRAVQAELSGMP